MPTYSYNCTNCQKDFELFFYIKDYIETPACTHCTSQKTERKYIDDVLTQNTSVKKADSELKSIGDLANRNRDKLTEDQKTYLYQKHNNYKDNMPDKPLPKGMSRMKKPSKISWPKTKKG
jgi:putative FmdB family regulatory protein